MKDIYDINYYDYDLPEELIAQTPLENRSDSRLLVLNKTTGEVSDRTFTDVLDYLNPGDSLVLNDTKVIPARLIGIKEKTGAVIELLLLKNIEGDKWEVLLKPAKRMHEKEIISFGDGSLKAMILEKKDEGIAIAKLIYKGIIYEILDKLAMMPLPPYIHETLKDNDRYQTVYAKNLGSAAAPTAGLHFTKELLEKIKEKGVNIVYVTLHVSLGTFRPVKVDNILEHDMHSEYFSISREAADELNKAKNEGHKIIAVGTTSTRVLESIYSKFNKFKEYTGETKIFIYPGYEFKAIDSLITNFHLPKSTLIMLVSALAGRDNIINAYNHAVKEKYRFFSFGDAMIITDFNKE